MDDSTSQQTEKPEDIDTSTEITEPKANAEEAAESTDNQKNTSKNQVKEKKKRFRFTKKQWIIITVVVLLVLAVAGWLVFGRKQAVTPTQDAATQTAPKVRNIEDVTYFDEAKKIEALNLITDYKVFGEKDCDPPDYITGCEPIITAEDMAYYQIGSTKDGGRVIVAAYGIGMEYGDLALVENEDEHYTLLALMSSGLGLYDTTSEHHTDTVNRLTAALDSRVSIDDKTKLPDTTFPEEVEIAGQKMKNESKGVGYFILGGLNSLRGSFWGELKHGLPTKIGEKDGKTFYKALISDNPTYTVHEFFATVKGVYAARYIPSGEVASNKDKVTYKWTNGEQNSSIYFSAGAGCGSAGGYVAAKNIDKSILVSAGTTPGGQKLYQLPTTHPLVVELFEKDYAKGEQVQDANLKNLTVQQLTDKHGYFVVENGLGELVVFLRDDLFIRGGCAKPVVYLYPTKSTSINVHVGADVVISEPTYPKDGWKNVLAQPNGNLTYQGKSYGSLFWEGYGHGPYPEITSGTVVATSNAVATMRDQLAQQGLRGREIDEFIEFWETKLPNKPYVRISWLSTSQLNQLAPLTINPRPQTIIRTFLDFEGLDQPIAIPSQKFSAPKRSGFTVVEWGGLLRGGIKH